MSNKTIFKRIALAVVTALGAGVLTTLSVTGASATPHGGDTLTIGTPSKTSVVQGDTVSVTVDYAWTTSVAGETATVLLGGEVIDFATAYIVASSTDSANVTNHGVITTGSAYGGTAISSTSGDTVTATAAGTYTRAKFTIYLANFTAPASAKTVTYTVAVRSGGATGPIEQSANFTLTLNAKDTVGVASKSLVWLNQTTTTVGVNAPRADSALVVSAGTTTPTAVGYLWQEARNASDTTNSTTSSSRDVTASFTVQITGPGLLAKSSASTTYAKAVTVTAGDTVIVHSDGTAGTATITTSIGATNLTQAAKTITFFGKPATITATLDSAVVSSSGTANRMISFVVKDSAGNNLSDASPVYNTGTPGGFYAVYSDTTVVTGLTAIAGGTAAYTQCSTYSATAGKWYCNLAFNDSGTATVTIVDSLTVGTAVVSSSALTVVASGTGYTGTASFDKSTYNTGEKAILTLTSKDSGGRNVANGDSHPWAATVRWTTNAATFTASSGSDAAGGTFTNILNYLNSGQDVVTFVNGVDTAVVFMPTVAGTYTLVGRGAGGSATTESTILTFTVVDPAQAANAAAIAAAQAASDAATDAANEAIDAANAATDAANLAAEAADAATVAAEEARDAADAATAAVEELATQVATLMAALKAQLTTLANTVAKIAKKVKA